jgi:preprotein translocase subunit SecE
MNENLMSMDLNREQKRQLKKMGALDDKGQPTRAPRTATAKRPDEERTSIPQYFREVRAEMRKVAWPAWPEVKRYSIVVLVTVVVFMAYVGGLDALFNVFSGWLYGR